MDTRKRAVIYIRVSTKEQAGGDKASLEVQQRDCETYCRNRGYDIVHLPYVDIQSGTDSRKERASFEGMLAEARKGACDVIVAWRPDRLFRSLWPAARLKQVMDATGIEAETVTLPMDTSTLGLWAWFAEREIANIKERTLVGRESMARAGKLATGNPPYGFRYDRSIQQLRHHEQEKPRAQMAFEWVAQGKSISSLVARLNQLGILTRQGKPWRRQQVVKMLKNPVYAGRAYWGKRDKSRGIAAREAREEKILVPVTPLIPEELFQKVQQQLQKNRSTSPRNTRLVYTLQHLLRCRVCGKSFGSRSHSLRHGKPLKTPERYYGCQGMKQSPGAYRCRRPTELSAVAVERAVWEKVAEAFANPQALVQILESRNATAQEDMQALRADLAAATDRVSRKQTELQQLLTWARQNLLSADELRPQLAEVRDQKQHWEQEIDRLNQRLTSLESGEQSIGYAGKLCLSVRDRLANMTDLDKKEFLRLVVERVWVDGNNNLEIEVVIPGQAHPDMVCETARSRAGMGE